MFKVDNLVDLLDELCVELDIVRHPDTDKVILNAFRVAARVINQESNNPGEHQEVDSLFTYPD
jgi:hypothetical protein